MNILFDIGHPAHVHLFKNVIKFLNSENHEVKVVSRAKEVTNDLLDFEGIKYECLTKPSTSKIGMAFELAKRDLGVLRLNKKKSFDLAIGTSVSAAHLTLLKNVPSLIFNEDDDDVVPLFCNITFPFATKIIHPNEIRFTKWGEKRIKYSSYHELAYLHPNNFVPNNSVLEKYGLKSKEYILVRKSALTAHHDSNAKGLHTELYDMLISLAGKKRIITSDELKKSKIKPWDMLDILNGSSFLFSDSQTMSVEAAMLGVPSIRYNSFARKCSILTELETEYKLTFAFLPYLELDNCIKKTTEIFNEIGLDNKIWNERKLNLLKNKVDFNKWIINYLMSEKWIH